MSPSDATKKPIRDPAPPESPGAALAAERRRQGLELAAVSESVGISQEVLMALESDDWERLDAPVYVRGYLRKYARLLGLDEEAILGTYAAAAAPRDPDVRAHATTGLGRHHDIRWLMPVTAAGLVVLFVLAGLWGWRHFHRQSSSVQAPSTAASAMLIPGAQSASKNHAAARHKSTSPQAVVVSTGPESAGPHPAVSGAGSPQLQLQLHMLKPSWVEVYGPGHKRLYYNLAPTGARLHFNSRTGPVSVFLGDASATQITLNGHPFEIPKKDIRGKTARFELQRPKKPSTAGTAP